MKNYLKEIFQLRKDFSKEEKKIISTSYKFAQKAHKGQKFDGQNYPYFIHPAYAGYLLAKWNQDFEVISAGILHDVIEDCGIQLLTIKKLFGERIAFLVDGMSWEIKWNFENKRYEKDWDGFFKKICKYSVQDPSIILLHCADERSKLEDILKKKFDKKDEKIEKTKQRLMRYLAFYVPLYKEIGLISNSKRLHDKILSITKEETKSRLYEFITQNELNTIRTNLSKINEIEELK
jgi:GTP pyrophosphokinase